MFDHQSRFHTLLAFSLLAAVLCLLFWWIYGGPALGKIRAQQDVARLEELMVKTGGECPALAQPHRLALSHLVPHASPDPGSPWTEWYRNWLRAMRTWQQEGGLPKVSPRGDLARLTPEERREVHGLLRRLEAFELVFLHPDAEDLQVLSQLQAPVSLDCSKQELTPEMLRWLRRIPEIRRLDLSGTGVGDADIKGLHGVRQLFLGGTQVTGAALPELATHDLQLLDLSRTAVGDADMKELASISSLVVLNLAGTGVTDAGLKELAPLGRLQGLDLSGTAVGDSGLKELVPLAALYRLNLSGTAVDDAGMKELLSLAALYRIDLSGTKVGDAGMKTLAGHPQLSRLSLKDTAVGDAGLMELAKMPLLVSLRPNSKMSSEAIDRFQDRRHQSGLPEVQILGGGLPGFGFPGGGPSGFGSPGGPRRPAISVGDERL